MLQKYLALENFEVENQWPSQDYANVNKNQNSFFKTLAYVHCWYTLIVFVNKFNLKKISLKAIKHVQKYHQHMPPPSPYWLNVFLKAFEPF